MHSSVVRRTGNVFWIAPSVVRAWLIHPEGYGWMGRTIGIPEPDAWTTEIGPYDRVLEALQAGHIRMGLPIVVTDRRYEKEAAAC